MMNPNVSIFWYKAWLVAKGFYQHPSNNYKETFNIVLKPKIFKNVLHIKLSKSWNLMKIDINNAFLNGTPNEEDYMAQLPGLVH
jgi:hypothetical protein